MPRFTFRAFDDGADLPVSAQEAGEELDRIRNRYGTLQPAAVVDESRPDEAPLHPVFEWDDEQAAERYREHQAASLIKRVKVVVEPTDDDDEPAATPVRAVRDNTDYEPLPVDDYDPLRFELSEALGAVVQAHRMVEILRQKAFNRNDVRKRVAAEVAAKDLEQAEESCADAEEALQNVHTPLAWVPRNPPVPSV